MPNDIESLLTPGELVFNPRAAEQAGLANLDRFNKTGNVATLGNFNPSDVSVVPGRGTSDSVPRTLEPGSFVVRKSSSEQSGLDEGVQFLNRGGRAARESNFEAGIRDTLHLSRTLCQL